MSYTFHKDGGWVGDGDDAEVQPAEVEGQEVADPTAMSGTLDTSGTSGVTETAEDVSPVFDVADEQAAANVATEGNLGVVEPADGQTEAQASVEAAGTPGDPAADADADDAEDKFDGRKNPSDYAVKDVVAYFDGATQAQIDKVKAKEAEGQNRKGIMNYEKKA